MKGLKERDFNIMDDKHTIQKIQHTCIIHIFHAVLGSEPRYTVVAPSAVFWHLCVAISPLNSCLIIPNLREYSNEVDNALFHMILQSLDSCSAAFGCRAQRRTNFSIQLLGAVERPKRFDK